jgi:hypothetical protein
MTEPPPDTKPEPAAGPARPWLTYLGGILMGDLAIGLLYGAGVLLVKKSSALAMLGFPSLFLVPVFGGLIASYLWRTLNPTIRVSFFNSLWMTALALVAGMLAFHEGVICLVIVAPFFFLSVFTGALLGRLCFKTDPTRMRLSLLPLLALGILAEPATRADKEAVVTDELLIHASPARVWQHVKAFPDIPSRPQFWLFRLGLPYPMTTTSSGDFVNADRECIFSGHAIFKERVAELIPDRKLTFEILESPPDPELVGHLTAHRGQFLLRPNEDGTTTLVGSTWYTLQVRPRWYFDLWTRHIFRAVHLRVMEDIRRRAEHAE